MKNVNRILGIDRLHRMGYLGEGVTVAVLDSGISLHPDIRDRVIGFKDFVKKKELPYDDLGHGTHVSGIIAGNGMLSGGMYKGVAPKANIVSVKVLNKKGTGDVKNVIEGIYWIIDHGLEYKIRVVNMSFGSRYYSSDEGNKLIRAVEELWKLGYVVVAAAGNNGPEENSISVPGSCEKIITVGAADDREGGYVGGVYRKNYSGRGNPDSNINKPDIVAPANRIYSCCNLWKQKYIYVSKTGTSMAAPIVSGIAALMIGANPNLKNYECKRIIKTTAIDLHMAQTKQGKGIVNPEGIIQFITRQ